MAATSRDRDRVCPRGRAVIDRPPQHVASSLIWQEITDKRSYAFLCVSIGLSLTGCVLIGVSKDMGHR